MKKNKATIILVTIVVIFVVLFVLYVDLRIGNRQLIDTTQRFDYAMIKLADGELVEGRVDSWMDFENSDQIQLTINGTTYLTHCMNVTLIKN